MTRDCFEPGSIFLIFGRMLLRLLGYRAQTERGVTDEEIRMLIAEAESSGVIEPGERTMIAGVMRVGDRPVQAVITPATPKLLRAAEESCGSEALLKFSGSFSPAVSRASV